MKHCIIAVRTNYQYPKHSIYSSITCHYDQCSDIGYVLRKRYNSIGSIKELLSVGDVNSQEKNQLNDFHNKWGYAWNETASIIHISLTALISYSDNMNADRLHIFEDNAWESLLLREPEEVLMTA